MLEGGEMADGVALEGRDEKSIGVKRVLEVVGPLQDTWKCRFLGSKSLRSHLPDMSSFCYRLIFASGNVVMISIRER